jgi:hypothetical protein
MAGAATIGLISDTHGLMRQEAFAALAGADLIIHAGDIGKLEVIEQLRTLAPVVAVRGNVDTGAWALRFPATAVAEVRSGLIYVLHDIGQLDLDPAAAGFGLVVRRHLPARETGLEIARFSFWQAPPCSPAARSRWSWLDGGFSDASCGIGIL